METTKNPHTRGDSRLCCCGNKISGRDTHPVCSTCLWVDHARLALEIPGSCGHCKVFTAQPRRKTRSWPGKFWRLATTGPPSASSSELPRFPEEDVLEIGLTEDDDDASFLISEDEEEDDTFVAPALAEKPKLPESTNREEGGVSSPAPSLHVDLLSTCKRAAEKLEVPWPVAIAEPTRSRYEGKRLPLARSVVKQLLPVFPKLLAELSKTWNNCPYSKRSPIPGAASLDCEAMEALGLLSMPPVEAPVAAHLCPGSTSQLSAASSRRPTLPTKPERFQSALAERAYKAAALSARALSALSILTAYQAELFGASADEQDPDAWEETAVIADLSLRIQRVSVQATGRVMATLVIQERAY
uniref:Uncharacterized protein n=1 Tax=Larimichthys crocea TaxID=215358 RepID=A0A0F8BIA7_LARCR